MRNALYPRDPHRHLVYLIDRQFWNVGIGPNDLVFMVARHADPATRRGTEMPLTRATTRGCSGQALVTTTGSSAGPTTGSRSCIACSRRCGSGLWASGRVSGGPDSRGYSPPSRTCDAANSSMTRHAPLPLRPPRRPGRPRVSSPASPCDASAGRAANG
jgi:hypothetical protein